MIRRGAALAILSVLSSCTSAGGARTNDGGDDAATQTIPRPGASCSTHGGHCVAQASCMGDIGLSDCDPATICCLTLQPPSCRDANAPPLDISSYDRSCKTDIDCAPVGIGDVCAPCRIACPNASINVVAVAQYRADLKNAGWIDTSPICYCPLIPSACCSAGTCTIPCGDLPPADGGGEAEPGDASPDASGEAGDASTE